MRSHAGNELMKFRQTREERKEAVATGKRFCGVVMLAIVAIAFSGCVFPKEGDKVVVDQTKKAGITVQEVGKAIEATGLQLQAAADPGLQQVGAQLVAQGKALEQAGTDVELNSARMQEVIGMPKPENQKPYSAPASRDARDRSAEEHANPWWKVAGGWLVGIVFGGTGIAVLQRFFPGFFAGPLGVAATAVMEAIARVRQVAAARADGKVSMDELLAELKRIQENQGVQTVVRDMAHKIEKKLFGKKISEPEAAGAAPAG